MKRLLLSALLVVLVSCGGADGDGAERTSGAAATDAVGEAVEATAAAGSVAFEMTVEFEGGSQVPEGTKIHMTGRSTLGDPRTAELSADFEALGVGDIDMLIDDQHLYMHGGVFDRALDSLEGEPEWVFVDLTSSDPAVDQFRSLSSGQNDASLLLYFLLGADGDLEELGTDDVGGVPTTHYSLTADLERAVDEAPADVQDALRSNVALLQSTGVGTRVEAEVWIDDDHLIRQVAYVYELTQEGGGSLLTTASFSEFGKRIELDIPGPNDIVDVTEIRG